jgi:uncharacterized membrane protein (DUF4010 family)
VRTFLLIGLLGGTAGLLYEWELPLAATTLLASGVLFVAIAYVMAVRRPGISLDGTTEGAALVVLALGVLAGLGQMGLASGAAAVVVLVLGEKKRLHWFVRHIGETEMRATLQFMVLALVVLPLLPKGPYGPLGGIRPRMLWSIVVLLSGINFAGFIARRTLGADRGYGIVGALGGIVSSTAVTFQFSRISVSEPALGISLAFGVVAACTVLLARVTVVAAVLNAPVALALLPYVVLPAMVGVVLLIVVMRRRRSTHATDADSDLKSPLRLWSAIQMAAVFQVAMMVVALAKNLWGDPGVTASALALGLTDVDALTVSMSRLGEAPNAVPLAARSIAVGILANTVFKLAVAAMLGAGTFRKTVTAGLALVSVAIGVGLWMLGWLRL